MRDALTLDSRLHRDISIGNILLVKERDRDIRRGYLIDWECSCNVDELGRATQSGRVVCHFLLTVLLSVLTEFTGDMGVHIDQDAPGFEKCSPAYHPGRHGVLAICCFLLRSALASSQPH